MRPEPGSAAASSEATAAGSESVMSPEPAIDLVHLKRMTLGEQSLAREVLRLFDRQAEFLLTYIKHASPRSAARLAHTLKGAARGIGAWKVATAAEHYELAARASDCETLARDFEERGRAIGEARSSINALLGAATND